MGPLEIEVNQLMDDALSGVPLSQGGTWGEASGAITLTPDDRYMVTEGRVEGLKAAVRRIARELDSD